MTAVHNAAVFEAMLQKQLFLLHLETNAPGIFNGLAIAGAGVQAAESTPSSILSDLNTISAEVSKTSPEIALQAQKAAETGYSMVSK